MCMCMCLPFVWYRINSPFYTHTHTHTHTHYIYNYTPLCIDQYWLAQTHSYMQPHQHRAWKLLVINFFTVLSLFLIFLHEFFHLRKHINPTCLNSHTNRRSIHLLSVLILSFTRMCVLSPCDVTWSPSSLSNMQDTHAIINLPTRTLSRGFLWRSVFQSDLVDRRCHQLSLTLHTVQRDKENGRLNIMYRNCVILMSMFWTLNQLWFKLPTLPM